MEVQVDGEHAPTPLEVIEGFEAAHNALIESAFLAHAQPSHAGLENVAIKVNASVLSMHPFFEREFFKTEDGVTITSGVVSVMNSTIELAEKTRVINPDWVADAAYVDDAVDVVTQTIIEDEDNAAARASAELCSDYKNMAENFQRGLMNSPRVSKFLEEDAKAVKRKERVVLYAGVAAAAFAGTLLADRFRRR